MWVITNYDDGTTQAVSPQDATSLQVDDKSGNLTVLPAAGYAWVIKGEDDIYTIQDGGYTSFWGIKEAAVGQNVVLSTADNSDLQNWRLIAA